MIGNTIRAALIELIKSKRRKMSKAQRRRPVKPTRWLYPWATERHYAAAIRAWIRPMKDYIHKYLKENQEAILRGDSIDFTVDNADSIPASRLDAVPGKRFKRMIDSTNGWMGQYVPDDDENKSGSPIYMGLGNIADSVFDFNEGQYEKSAKSVLGVEFPVGEDWWPFARDIWANKNYDLIKDTLMKPYISQVNDLTERAVTAGWSVSQLTKQIHGLDDKITKSKANFIARDQIGKLNGEITQRRMESVGLMMYVWETSGDERVRPSHEMMDGGLCLWSDPSVYSQDGGKTWIDRPAGAVLLHPGMDYQCRCTAIAYWQELVGEVDEMIAQYEELDVMSAQNISAMPNLAAQTSKASTVLQGKPANSAKQNETKDRQREKNARNAKKAADQLFPGEKWKKIDNGIYLSPRRPIGGKTNFKTEKHDALILKLLGSTVYLVPEERNDPGKKYDAIVDGERFEFKNMEGASTATLKDHFLRSRKQAPNVFINLENSPLTKSEIIRTLYRARNSEDYKKHNTFKGGKIILKIRGQTGLIHLDIDSLKLSGI
jgi:SPP1 gp7 family putative phage head morphogenesis protein